MPGKKNIHPKMEKLLSSYYNALEYRYITKDEITRFTSQLNDPLQPTLQG